MNISRIFLAAILCQPLTEIRAESVKVSDDAPIPYLSWQDIKALYSPKHYPGDWDNLKLKDYPHKAELIEQCKQDLKLSVKANSDPFHKNHPLLPGKLVLNCITKDSENRIIYFVFDYESDMVYDLFVVYYFDPLQGRFILKSTR